MKYGCSLYINNKIENINRDVTGICYWSSQFTKTLISSKTEKEALCFTNVVCIFLVNTSFAKCFTRYNYVHKHVYSAHGQLCISILLHLSCCLTVMLYTYTRYSKIHKSHSLLLYQGNAYTTLALTLAKIAIAY